MLNNFEMKETKQKTTTITNNKQTHTQNVTKKTLSHYYFYRAAWKLFCGLTQCRCSSCTQACWRFSSKVVQYWADLIKLGTLPTKVDASLSLSKSIKRAASWQNQQNGMCMKKGWVFSYLLSAQRTLWSDWADAQADLSFRCAHMPLCWFCHEAAH